MELNSKFHISFNRIIQDNIFEVTRVYANFFVKTKIFLNRLILDVYNL